MLAVLSLSRCPHPLHLQARSADHTSEKLLMVPDPGNPAGRLENIESTLHGHVGRQLPASAMRRLTCPCSAFLQNCVALIPAHDQSEIGADAAECGGQTKPWILKNWESVCAGDEFGAWHAGDARQRAEP